MKIFPIFSRLWYESINLIGWVFHQPIRLQYDRLMMYILKNMFTGKPPLDQSDCSRGWVWKWGARGTKRGARGTNWRLRMWLMRLSDDVHRKWRNGHNFLVHFFRHFRNIVSGMKFAHNQKHARRITKMLRYTTLTRFARSLVSLREKRLCGH